MGQARDSASERDATSRRRARVSGPARAREGAKRLARAIARARTRANRGARVDRRA